jgi:hypothetical protein
MDSVAQAVKRSLTASAEDSVQEKPKMPQSSSPPQIANLHQQIHEWKAIMDKEREDMKKLNSDHEARMKEHEVRLNTLMTMAEQQTVHRMDGQGLATPPGAKRAPNTPDLESKKAEIEGLLSKSAEAGPPDEWQQPGACPWSQAKGPADGGPRAPGPGAPGPRGT